MLSIITSVALRIVESGSAFIECVFCMCSCRHSEGKQMMAPHIYFENSNYRDLNNDNSKPRYDITPACHLISVIGMLAL